MLKFHHPVLGACSVHFLRADDLMRRLIGRFTRILKGNALTEGQFTGVISSGVPRGSRLEVVGDGKKTGAGARMISRL